MKSCATNLHNHDFKSIPEYNDPVTEQVGLKLRAIADPDVIVSDR